MNNQCTQCHSKAYQRKPEVRLPAIIQEVKYDLINEKRDKASCKKILDTIGAVSPGKNIGRRVEERNSCNAPTEIRVIRYLNDDLVFSGVVWQGDDGRY